MLKRYALMYFAVKRNDVNLLSYGSEKNVGLGEKEIGKKPM